MRARFAVGFFAAVAVSAPWARADAPAHDAGYEPHEFAAQEHQAAQVAARAKDWPSAAAHLENAFFAVPTAQELRAAIYARLQAKQYARAATLAALGLRKYDGDAKTAQQATAAIQEARPHVFDLTVTCATECGVVADDKVVTIERAKEVELFLDAGRHPIEVSWADGATKTVTVDAKDGAKDTIAVEPPPKKDAPAVAPAPPPAPAPPRTSAPAPSHAPDAPARGTKPFGPAVFWTGLGLTVVAAGVTVWSGIDAQNNPGRDAVLRECVGLGESCPAYQRGRDAQLRTNVLIGVSSGLAVTTAVVGLFLTQWSKPAAVTPVVGLGTVGVAGAF